ncbi:MAG: glycoside hydrolase family 127 protein [Candidatus Pedobacter colombiensis]|uniref:Glycoside hydrolase family 127 protein n=1 Tax=Candidatus Pedobacter colombiensis TaxID=3121371 RepID=A0AAJ6B860_9SPHI|nr:glycoside hydrolase family 127 protein [Pedobacter sp.]WEK20191.1 MAG: glycoside hydrolase family 127 protein [Pedobacter sp.]
MEIKPMKIFFCIFFGILTLSVSAQKESKVLESFPLSRVSLLDGPFKQAQQTDMKYILSLSANRLLAPYLKEAGLKPKAEQYGNWENTGLDGHIGGHYLSALAFMYAATGNAELKSRIDYMLDELDKCQISNGDGYLGGIPGGKAMWKQIADGNIKASGFSLNGKWVPLYNIHKIYAGLYDVYAQTGNVKARQMLIRLTDWCVKLVANLSDEQIQTMLKSEHGGLNEVFANVAVITGNKKYLELARRFSDHKILDPLLQSRDALNGLHANTQIPKVIGFIRVAEVSADSAWAKAADFFWQTVVSNRTVAIGGNSVHEHFHPANDFSSMMESREGPETCNSYNMLKLTNHLFLAKASSKYMDYYERTLYNHILSSQHPDGGFVYFTPMRPVHYRVYSQAQESFWCCVGSGLENHGKYGELIYAHTDKDLFVNLYIASALNWKEKGVEMVQRTNFPESENTMLTLKLARSNRFTLHLRYPSWIEKDKMEVYVNGKKQAINKDSNDYVGITRLWNSGDVVKVKLPMHTSTEFLPDKSDWVAFVRGPIVLAAAMDTLDQPGLRADGSRMGHIASGQLYPLDKAPLVVGSKDNLIRSDDLFYQPKYKNLKLVPFYTLNDTRYIIYFPYSSQENLPERLASIKQKEQAEIDLEQRTVDVVRTGEQQPESDHNFKGEKTEAGLFMDRHFRAGTGWFSYNFKNKAQTAKTVRLTFFGKDKNKMFDILINNKPLTTITLDGTKEATFFNEVYAIPAELLNTNPEIKIMAKEGSSIANIYEIRLMK